MVDGTTIEEKIAAIDEELRTLQHFLISKGHSPLEIERCAEPFYSSIQYSDRKNFVKTLTQVVLVIAVFIGLCYFDPTSKLMVLHTRIAFMKALPFWDWTHLYRTECMIGNPMYEGNKLTNDDCEACEAIEDIPRLKNLTKDTFSTYLKSDAPVIVTDAIASWRAMTGLNTLSKIHKVFTTNSKLNLVLGCEFKSNVKVAKGNNRYFLHLVTENNRDNWYGYWENCIEDAPKAVREYYERPYFFPPSSMLDKKNWVLLSSNYKGKLFKPLPLEEPMVWFAQIAGEATFKLVPKSPCNDTCSELIRTLYKGDMMVSTDLYYVDYLPSSHGVSITLAGSGTFD